MQRGKIYAKRSVFRWRLKLLMVAQTDIGVARIIAAECTRVEVWRITKGVGYVVIQPGGVEMITVERKARLATVE